MKGMGESVEFAADAVNDVVVCSGGVVRSTETSDYVGGITEEV